MCCSGRGGDDGVENCSWRRWRRRCTKHCHFISPRTFPHYILFFLRRTHSSFKHRHLPATNRNPRYMRPTSHTLSIIKRTGGWIKTQGGFNTKLLQLIPAMPRVQHSRPPFHSSFHSSARIIWCSAIVNHQRSCGMKCCYLEVTPNKNYINCSR